MMTIEEIKQQILTAKNDYQELNDMDSTGKSAIYNLWAYIVASVIWVLYQFFDTHKNEVDWKLKAQKLYTLIWFRDKALEYRHGHALDETTGQYDDQGYTDEQIQAAKVVKRSAVIELELENRKFLFIKCATESGDQLAALSPEQLSGLEQYYALIKPAGTKIVIFSDAPDQLQLEVDFYYDPLILTNTGGRIDGSSNTPVQDAIGDYLKNLRFNGEFSIAELQDILQVIPGCASGEAYIQNASANYQTPENFQQITSTYIANSGYMDISDENLTINFIPKNVPL